jgi:hypothetical protein
MPEPPHAFVSVVNTFDRCDLNVTLVTGDGQFAATSVVPRNSSLTNDKKSGRVGMFKVVAGSATWRIDYAGEECTSEAVKQWDLPSTVTYAVGSGQIHYIYVGRMGSYIAKADPQKPLKGTGEFSMA